MRPSSFGAPERRRREGSPDPRGRRAGGGGRRRRATEPARDQAAPAYLRPPPVAARPLAVALTLTLSSCSWFTDFKDQPKMEPWESVSDSVPPRGNPQNSIPIEG